MSMSKQEVVVSSLVHTQVSYVWIRDSRLKFVLSGLGEQSARSFGSDRQAKWIVPKLFKSQKWGLGLT